MKIYRSKDDEGSFSDTCDICRLIDKNKVVAGRWIFYCPDHKQYDIDKTYENEIEPALESGDLDDYEALEAFI